jgi:hypothetical protein
MKTRLVTLALLLTFCFAHVALAQDKPATAPVVPTVSVEDSLRITNALLNAENLNFKQVQLTADLAKAKTAFEALLKGLEKPGFVLQRGADGAFVYVPAPVDADKK